MTLQHVAEGAAVALAVAALVWTALRVVWALAGRFRRPVERPPVSGAVPRQTAGAPGAPVRLPRPRDRADSLDVEPAP